MSNKLTRFCMSLIGKSWAYESAEDIREVIAKNNLDSQAARSRTHTKGAARLTDSYAFQPGLIDLHNEMLDTLHYLVGLADQATWLGYDNLAWKLGAAADSTRDTLVTVATAAEATIAAPEPPVATR
ncbi:hypothetical protein [Streptomyces sp. NPDC093589]|uniref:hypothetical protein n=1 Tax=Streptomyces sp. NPDC093589 TaxID=3366043 RepID=UPI00381B3A06